MTKKLSASALSAIALTAGLCLANPVWAGQVTLTSPDGSVDMTGDFVDFRDNAYIIITSLGEMRVSANRVTCVGADCPSLAPTKAPGVIIGGSDTVGLGLMPLLLEGYAGALDAVSTITPTGNGDDILAEMIGGQGFGDELASIFVSSTTSSDGFAKLLSGDIEIGMASRRIRPEEARALRDVGGGNMVSPAQEHIVAADSLIVITNPENPVTEISKAQLRDIYSGLITNWSQIGGPDLEIMVVQLPAGSGTRSVFEDRIFGSDEAPAFATAVLTETNASASNLVSENEGAIAFVSYAFQRGATALTLINDCGIATTPDAFSARTEEYDLQRRLYLYTREDTEGQAAREFLDFATSEEADTVIGKAGFIGFAVDRRKQSLDDARARSLLNADVDAYEANFMRQMLAQMVGYDRLSTTFRFRVGSAQLDARGLIDKERLVNYLAKQPDGTEVLVVGFTDSIGEFDSNLNLSLQRAGQVADEISAFAGDRLTNVAISSIGFGEIAPVSCNDEEDGRRINRRVEVWVKSAT